MAKVKVMFCYFFFKVMIFLECKSDLVRSYENSCELNKDEAWNKDSQNPHKSGAGKMAISVLERQREIKDLWGIGCLDSVSSVFT